MEKKIFVLQALTSLPLILAWIGRTIFKISQSLSKLWAQAERGAVSVEDHVDTALSFC